MCIHAHVRVFEGLQRQVLLLGFRSTVAALPLASQLKDKLCVHTLHHAFQLTSVLSTDVTQLLAAVLCIPCIHTCACLTVRGAGVRPSHSCLTESFPI